MQPNQTTNIPTEAGVASASAQATAPASPPTQATAPASPPTQATAPASPSVASSGASSSTSLPTSVPIVEEIRPQQVHPQQVHPQQQHWVQAGHGPETYYVRSGGYQSQPSFGGFDPAQLTNLIFMAGAGARSFQENPLGYQAGNPYNMGGYVSHERRMQLDLENLERARAELARAERQMQMHGASVYQPVAAQTAPGVVVNCTSAATTEQTADQSTLQETNQDQRSTQADISTTTPSSARQSTRPRWLQPAAWATVGVSTVVGITAVLAHIFQWGNKYEHSKKTVFKPTWGGFQVNSQTTERGKRSTE